MGSPSEGRAAQRSCAPDTGAPRHPTSGRVVQVGCEEETHSPERQALPTGAVSTRGSASNPPLPHTTRVAAQEAVQCRPPDTRRQRARAAVRPVTPATGARSAEHTLAAAGDCLTGTRVPRPRHSMPAGDASSTADAAPSVHTIYDELQMPASAQRTADRPEPGPPATAEDCGHAPTAAAASSAAPADALTCPDESPASGSPISPLPVPLESTPPSTAVTAPGVAHDGLGSVMGCARRTVTRTTHLLPAAASLAERLPPSIASTTTRGARAVTACPDAAADAGRSDSTRGDPETAMPATLPSMPSGRYSAPPRSSGPTSATRSSGVPAAGRSCSSAPSAPGAATSSSASSRLLRLWQSRLHDPAEPVCSASTAKLPLTPATLASWDGPPTQPRSTPTAALSCAASLLSKRPVAGLRMRTRTMEATRSGPGLEAPAAGLAAERLPRRSTVENPAAMVALPSTTAGAPRFQSEASRSSTSAAGVPPAPLEGRLIPICTSQEGPRRPPNGAQAWGGGGSAAVVAVSAGIGHTDTTAGRAPGTGDAGDCPVRRTDAASSSDAATEPMTLPRVERRAPGSQPTAASENEPGAYTDSPSCDARLADREAGRPRGEVS